MIRRTACATCGHQSEELLCNGCGANIEGADDAVGASVGLMSHPAPNTFLTYCASCAPKHLPAAALGTGPGSDLPASLDPPEQP